MNETLNLTTSGFPASGKRVIFFWINGRGMNRISMGFYAEKNNIEADNWEVVEHADYCEKSDRYYFQAGWYEEAWESDCIYLIFGKVVAWQEQPKFPDIKS